MGSPLESLVWICRRAVWTAIVNVISSEVAMIGFLNAAKQNGVVVDRVAVDALHDIHSLVGHRPCHEVYPCGNLYHLGRDYLDYFYPRISRSSPPFRLYVALRGGRRSPWNPVLTHSLVHRAENRHTSLS